MAPSPAAKSSSNMFVDFGDEEKRKAVAAEAKAEAEATGLVGFIHRNRDWINNSVRGEVLTQTVRSALACIPYGFGMALSGRAIHLAEGMAGSNVWGAKHVGEFLKLDQHKFFKSGVMIASGFTLYRATSKLGRAVKDFLFYPDDSVARTQAKVNHLGEYTWERVKEIYPTEARSTPIAAFVLGVFEQMFDLGRHIPNPNANAELFKTVGSASNLAHAPTMSKFHPDYVAGPGKRFANYNAPVKSGLLTQGFLRGAFGYSLFFNAADRQAESITAMRYGEGGPVSAVMKQINKEAPPTTESNAVVYTRSLAPTLRLKDAGDPNAAKEGEKDGKSDPKTNKLAWLGTPVDPKEFVMRYVVPGIPALTAYTFLKRAMYANTGLFAAGAHTGKGVAPLMNEVWKEGVATVPFAVVAGINENWAKFRDGKHKPTLPRATPSAPKPNNDNAAPLVASQAGKVAADEAPAASNENLDAAQREHIAANVSQLMSELDQKYARARA